VPQIVRADASRIDDAEPLWLALRDHHGGITPDWWELRDPEESWSRRRAMYEAILDEGGVLFLAEDEGRVVGLAMCEREEGGGSPTWAWPADFLAIVDLVVLPEARGKGVGEVLVKAAEEEARTLGVAALDLNVVASNDTARRFYETQGFDAHVVTYRKRL
jgi:GNAT superfamily N-acetyltransferase